MLVSLKAGWTITLWMGMTRAPTPDRSTDPRLTAQSVGLGSLWASHEWKLLESELFKGKRKLFFGVTSTFWSSVLQSVTICCESVWHHSGEVFCTGGFQSRATLLYELLLPRQSYGSPVQDARRNLEQKHNGSMSFMWDCAACAHLCTSVRICAHVVWTYHSFFHPLDWGSRGLCHILGWLYWCKS